MRMRRATYDPAEFLVEARQLSDAEAGIYWRICSLIYSHGGAVEQSEVELWCSSRKPMLRAAIDRLVATGHLVRHGSLLTQPQAEAAIERVAKRAATLRENGAKGGRPRRNINGLENQIGFCEKTSLGTGTAHESGAKEEDETNVSNAIENQIGFQPDPGDAAPTGCEHGANPVACHNVFNCLENQIGFRHAGGNDARVLPPDGPPSPLFPPTPPLSPLPPLNPPSPGPRNARARVRGTRLADDFTVPEDWISDGEAARKRTGLPLADLRLEAERFVNYWTSATGEHATKLSWKRTWLNWCISPRVPALRTNGHGRHDGDLFERERAALAEREWAKTVMRAAMAHGVAGARAGAGLGGGGPPTIDAVAELVDPGDGSAGHGRA